jgi:hypothetical protein
LLIALGWLDTQTMQQLGHSTITVTKDVYQEIEDANVGVDVDARHLSLDPNLSPSARLSLLYEAWWKRYGGCSAPNYEAWLEHRVSAAFEWGGGIAGARDLVLLAGDGGLGEKTPGETA